MNNVNKTLYIPLYGKAYVSRKGIILSDKKAEEIWENEGFELKGKSKSKWLAYYMGMRSAVFDIWLRKMIKANPGAAVLHIGCGMDSRIERVDAECEKWYDIDFPDVIEERKKYYKETEAYRMIKADARNEGWLNPVPSGTDAIVILEGVSMYFRPEELKKLLRDLRNHFSSVRILMDCYTVKAAKASKYKNPINDVGVTSVYGIDEPLILENETGMRFIVEHNMTPKALINQLEGFEKSVFSAVFGGKISRMMYRMYEFKSE